MNKYFWLLVAGVITLVPAVYLALIWPQLPAEVPVHFNAAGEPDRMGSPAMLWGLAGVPLFTFGLMLLLPRIDPKNQVILNANFQKLVLTIMAGTAAFSILLTHATVAGRVDTRWLLTVLCGMWVLLGNYTATVPPNYFAGIRTPWTLDNPDVWRRTHRIGGRAMVAAGLLALPLSWLLPGPWTFGLVLAVLLTATLGPAAYSYVLWRQVQPGAGAAS